MARHANGTTDKIVNTGAGIQIGVNTNQGFSFHFLFKGDAAPGTAAVLIPFGFAAPNAGSVNTAQNIGFAWSHTNAAFKQAAFIRTAGPTTIAAQLTSVLSGGVWYGIGATWDGSNLRAYLNGSLQATTACTSVSNDGVTRPLVSAFSAIAGTTNFCPGTMAEIGLTFGVLNASQLTALSNGATWAHVLQKDASGAQNSPLYWTLLGDSPEPSYADNHRPGTVTGTTVVNHPYMQSLVAFP